MELPISLAIGLAAGAAVPLLAALLVAPIAIPRRPGFLVNVRHWIVARWKGLPISSASRKAALRGAFVILGILTAASAMAASFGAFVRLTEPPSAERGPCPPLQELLEPLESCPSQLKGRAAYGLFKLRTPDESLRYVFYIIAPAKVRVGQTAWVLATLRPEAPQEAQNALVDWAVVDPALLSKTSVCADLFTLGFEQTRGSGDNCHRALPKELIFCRPNFPCGAQWQWELKPTDGVQGNQTITTRLSLIPESIAVSQTTPPIDESGGSTAEASSEALYSFYQYFRVDVDNPWYERNPDYAKFAITGFGAALGAAVSLLGLFGRKNGN